MATYTGVLMNLLSHQMLRISLAIGAFFTLQTAAYAHHFIVDSVGDEPDAVGGDGVCLTAAGTCTLRAAMEEAGSSTENDTISFAIPGTGVKTIRPSSSLPPTSRVYIDGFSQGGAGYAGAPLIVITGENAEYYSLGVQLGGESILEGVAINQFGLHGVVLGGSQLRASYVGLNARGDQALPNRDSAVLMGNQSSLGCDSTQVAQSLPACAFPVIISGNRRDAIEIVGNDVSINHTWIGLAADGKTVLGNNGSGIRIPLLMAGVVSDVRLGETRENRIVGQRGVGIFIADSGQASPSKIRIQQTILDQNEGGAIYMGENGFPINDLGDTDVGSNTLLNTPYLKSLSPDASVVNGELSLSGNWLLRGVSRARYLDVYVASSAPGDDAFKRATQAFLATFDLDSASNLATGTESYNVPGVGEDDARLFEVLVPATAQGMTLIGIARDQDGNSSILSDAVTSDEELVDSDGDGLPDLIEIAWGLDPHNPDSDGDSLSDGEEWGQGAQPRDTDGDGVIDALDPDDDGDGIPTKEEIETVCSWTDLDGDGLPAWLNTDSDGDGIPDSVEYQGAVAVDCADAQKEQQPPWNNVDSDGDGLCDTPFVQSGDCVGGEDWNANGQRDPGETNPYDPDTDGDGYCDGPKQTGSCVGAADNCPLVVNPDQKDSVGDGVGDACRCDDEQCPAGMTQCFADVDGDGVTGTAILFDSEINCADQSYQGRAMTHVDGGDCDDNNPWIHPDAIEVCDGVDNNCDGRVDSDDPQVATLNPGITGALWETVYDDKDHDGCGLAGTERYACSLDDEGVSTNTRDQDDTDGICCGNGILEEGELCDGDAIGDTTCPVGTFGVPTCQNNEWVSGGDGSCTFVEPHKGCIEYRDCYADLDGDGFTGTLRNIPKAESCADYATDGRPWKDTNDGDCNDNPGDDCAVNTYPGAPELCDGCLNNCSAFQADGEDESWYGDECELGGAVPSCAVAGLVCNPSTGASMCGVIGADPSTLYYRDGDGDGCGDPSNSMIVCEGEEVPQGYVRNAMDVDDTDGMCCGNGVVEEGEECDGNVRLCASVGDYTEGEVFCRSNCRWNVSECIGGTCGDGVVQESAGETCDPADPQAPEACRGDCTWCGDGVVQEGSGETCDVGADDAPENCREASCTFCGDGVVQTDEGEECEPDDNGSNTCAYGETHCTYCNHDCTIEQGETSYCGDGVVDEANGEVCDGGDGCTSDCQREDGCDDDDCSNNNQKPNNTGCACSTDTTPTLSWLFTCLGILLLLGLQRRRVTARRP